jgi:hypothetical protein
VDDLKENDWPIYELGGLVPGTSSGSDDDDDDDDDINKTCPTAHLLKRSTYFSVLHRRPK